MSEVAGIRVRVDVERAPVEWAARRLTEALPGARRVPAGADADLLIATATSTAARRLLAEHGVEPPAGAESFAIFGAGPRLVACGADAAGAALAAIELADRVRGAPPRLPDVPEPIRRAPANAVRGVVRGFVSERADASWFHDRDLWRDYLDLLAASRFNRLHLALGMGYDFFYQGQVTDTYFLFPYPYLVDVPGFDIAAEGVSAEERGRNLATLRFIGEETVRRGLRFQLGLWTHGYEWTEGEGINHRIHGLTPENHAPYCREAIARLLEACPAIGGVTLRVHGESGISEGAADFWTEVFAGIAGCGRRVEIDLHAKGLDHPVVEAALATGMPVVVSAKYAAEHMGLPYHLASIRSYERLPRSGGGQPGALATPAPLRDVMQLSAGTRAYTRYSYGDFLARDRAHDVLFRVWPGTQRLLLWDDPAFAAALSRSGGFGGAAGIEVCEPLFFAGRRGSPGEGVRAARDHRFYERTYRVLGRALYDPDARWAADGDGALSEALARSSRILPLVTMAHSPSAANNSFWPEVYTNMPIAPGVVSHYRDTALPATFGSASALDPAVFSSVDEFVAEALSRRLSGRATPLQVAAWLEELAAGAREWLARAAAPGEAGADVTVLAGLGRFFAHKLRAAVLYEAGRRLGDAALLHAAPEHYRSAREEWAALAAAGRHLPSDLVFGPQPHLRGSWADRQGAIEADIEALEREAARFDRPADAAERAGAWLALLESLGLPPAPPTSVRLTEAGDAAALHLRAAVQSAPPYGPVRRLTLSWRPVNQALHWSEVEMAPAPSGFAASIPRADVDPRYQVQYLLTAERVDGLRWQYPGLGADLLGQPYLVREP